MIASDVCRDPIDPLPPQIRAGLLALFTRGAKGMEPSIFGTAAARHARTILSETERLTQQMGAMARGELGSVRMGAIMEAVPGVPPGFCPADAVGHGLAGTAARP